MIRYDEMLSTYRKARAEDQRFYRETSDFALSLMRSLQAALAVPRDRFEVDATSEETGFDQEGWYRIRFTTLFPDYEGPGGGNKYWHMWRVRRDGEGWLVKIYTDATPVKVESAADLARLNAHFAEEFHAFLATTLRDWVDKRGDIGAMGRNIGFRVPSRAE